jgi:MFS family permease
MRGRDGAGKLGVFYGWWIVLAVFLNYFWAVALTYYGFAVFTPSLVSSLRLTRAQVMQGFVLGYVVVGSLFGFFAGALIDRLGARRVIRAGIGLVGLSLVLMGKMENLWQYYLLSITEVLGFVLSGPIPNQVLICNWFRVKRGQAMGYAYLGGGFGGAAAPVLDHFLIERFGWRRAFEILGLLILLILLPVVQWVIRSAPRDIGLFPDGAKSVTPPCAGGMAQKGLTGRAVRNRNFWLILAGTTLVIGAIGTVVQHLILFLKDEGYSGAWASAVLSSIVLSSLAGRVVVGYLADRYEKKNVMAFFYLLLAVCIPLLFLAHNPPVVWGFALLFGFGMGADYMLIPLVTAESFGLEALGKLLSLIISVYSIGQWVGPALAGRIFDAYHSYDPAWFITIAAAVLGAASAYAISPGSQLSPASSDSPYPCAPG